MTAERIRWDEDESARLISAALPLLVADPKKTLIDAVRSVQDTVLPEARRRNLQNIGSLPATMRAALEQRRAAALGTAETVPATALAEAQQVIQGLQSELALAKSSIGELTTKVSSLEAHIRTLEAVPKPPTESEVIRKFFSDVLADAIAKGAALPGVRLEPVKPPPPLPPTPKHDPLPPAAEKKSRPRVLVVGLKPEKQQAFAQRFDSRVRLSFWTDENSDLLIARAKNCDVAMVNVGFISHSSYDLVVKWAPELIRMTLHGTDIQLEQLETWLSRWVEKNGN